MANPTVTRMSPAELRRRLLAPSADTALPPIADEVTSAPLPPRNVKRSDASRFGGSIATQTAIGLDALAREMPAPLNPRHTPLPESRLDPAQFRRFDAGVPMAHPIPVGANGLSDSAEVEFLREQNAELTRLIEEMKPVLEEASAQELRIQSRDSDIEAQFAERDQKMAELQEQIANIPVPKVPKTRDELEEWSDELEQESAKHTQERRRLDDDRRQLQEDEEALEKQMRDMEVSMARERAQMARQETELKRLSAEIQHELEMLQRGDGTLREQLSKFQRRHDEVLGRGGASPPPAPVAKPAPPPVPAQKDSGLIGRLFRGNR